MNLEDIKSQLSHYRDLPFREYQEDAIQYIFDSDKRFCFLEAPTGSGKSLIAMVAGLAMGGVTYAVHSKVLQRQITDDFPEAKSLFGRANYPCIANDSLSCDECSHSKGSPCAKKGACIYEREKKATLKAQLKIFNYDYLLTEVNYVGRFSESHFNIIDEADNLENTLINFITLTFTSYALGRLGLTDHAESLKKTSKDTDNLLSTWIQFAEAAKVQASSIIRKLSSMIDTFSDNVTPEQAKVIKERIRVTRLLEKITLFIDNVDSSWVLDDSQEGKYIFRPLWLNSELSEQFIWRHAERWVLMSASFLPVKLEARRLGIPLDEIDYKILPSTFPIERRPIHIESAASLTAKTMEIEIPKVVKRIKEIVAAHPTEKGLIHAVSYKLSNAIVDSLRSTRLLVHNSTNRQEVLDTFIESDKPLVLVSPSMERGVSLEMDLCRFIIVAKAPFLSLGDRIVSARVYSSRMGNEWYQATMLLSVLQMTGRGMRSAEDFCTAYILDDQFKRVFLTRPLFLPDWWKDAVVW